MKLASQNKSPDQGNQGMMIHPGCNPDRDPNIPVAAIMRSQHEQQSVEVAAATVAAGGEGGTSAAAAAAFNAAHIKMSEADVNEIREGVRNGQSTPHAASTKRGRGGGSGTPDSSGCSSAAARSSAATALHGGARRAGDGSGASSSGSGGPTGDSAGDSGEASNTGSNDGESDGKSGTGSNSGDGSEQGFFGGVGMEADDDMSGEDYAYSFPMGAQGFAVSPKPTEPALNPPCARNPTPEPEI